MLIVRFSTSHICTRRSWGVLPPGRGRRDSRTNCGRKMALPWHDDVTSWSCHLTVLQQTDILLCSFFIPVWQDGASAWRGSRRLGFPQGTVILCKVPTSGRWIKKQHSPLNVVLLYTAVQTASSQVATVLDVHVWLGLKNNSTRESSYLSEVLWAKGTHI